MALLTMMLLPFMMSEHTSFLSRNAISAMFNCAIKVCVIAFLSASGLTAIGGFFDNIKSQFGTAAGDGIGALSIFIQLSLTVSFFFIMIHQIPKLVSGLLSGSPSMGAGDLVAPAKQAASIAGTTAGVGIGLARTGLNAGAGKMSAISNIAGGTKDMLTGGFKNMISSGSGASDIQAGMSKLSTGVSEAGKGLKAMGESVGGMVDNAIATSAPMKTVQNGYNAATNPYGFSPQNVDDGANRISYLSGKAVNKEGDEIYSGSGGGGNGNRGGGNGKAANANDDGTENAQHDKTVNDQVHVQHVTNLDDQGVNIDYSVGGQNYSVTVKHNPPKTPLNIEPINPNKE